MRLSIISLTVNKNNFVKLHVYVKIEFKISKTQINNFNENLATCSIRFFSYLTFFCGLKWRTCKCEMIKRKRVEFSFLSGFRWSGTGLSYLSGTKKRQQQHQWCFFEKNAYKKFSRRCDVRCRFLLGLISYLLSHGRLPCGSLVACQPCQLSIPRSDDVPPLDCKFIIYSNHYYALNF